MSGIVWLASYPKSGNTWFRAFLTNLLCPADAPASINALVGGPIAGSRSQFDEAVGYDCSELSFDEIDALRPEVYRQFAAEIRAGKGRRFRKIHDACTLLPDGSPVIPPDAVEAVIYIVRNPLDVCASLANHHGRPNFDALIERMGNPDFVSPRRTDFPPEQLPFRLLSWTGHVQSWLDAPGLRVHTVRYEDMVLAPEKTFAGAAAFLGLTQDVQEVQRACEASRFQELRRQEEAHGFEEKTVRGEFFFNEGQIGGWRDKLSAEQAARLIDKHAGMMRRLGYLDERNEPVF